MVSGNVNINTSSDWNNFFTTNGTVYENGTAVILNNLAGAPGLNLNYPPGSGGCPFNQSFFISAGPASLVKTDSFGDGWNGSRWNLINSLGVQIYSFTLSSGRGPETDNFTIPTTDNYTIQVTSGIYGHV